MNTARFFSRTYLACAFVCATAFADTEAPGKVTFSKDVAPILFDNCVACHRPGEVAPMSLQTFDEVRPWAKSIKEKVTTRAMPPWFADPAHGKFKNDARLSEGEIALLANWVDQGAPRGKAADMPELPQFAPDWQLGAPDHIITLPEVQVPADGPDYLPDLSVRIDIPEDRWVRAVEIRPGNRLVNHHVVLFLAGGGGGGMGGEFGILAVWAVGSPPTVFPEGMGRQLHAGEMIRTNMHYHPNGTATTDQSRVGLYYGEGEMSREVKSALNGPFSFEIPANAPNHELTSSWWVDQDVKITSFFPHMHLRGQDMKFTAVYPDGHSDVLINVPKWDFNWQLFYYPDQFVELPKGTRVDVVAHYDNSANNPHNPDPSVDVGFGLQSTDEMMFGIFEYFTVDGAAAKPVSDDDRLSMITKDLPKGDTYKINLAFGRDSLPTALVLPREGDGSLHLALHGQFMQLPVTDIIWDGDQYTFKLNIKFGGASASFMANGTVGPDGAIKGDFGGAGGGMFQLAGFEGKRAAS
ncbi:MAG: thiol-disulfide isomerase [Candidatus Hydrogenedentota bacterium]